MIELVIWLVIGAGFLKTLHDYMRDTRRPPPSPTVHTEDVDDVRLGGRKES